MRLAIPSLAVVALCTALPVISEDLTIVSKVTHDGGPAESRTSYISTDHARILQPDGNEEAIFDLKSGQMTVLKEKKRTYYVMTRQDRDAIAVKVQDQTKRAQEQMKNLPPDVRQKMESAMGAAMGGILAADVQRTGTSRTIAGYKCENWIVTMGDFARSEECLTNELKLPVRAWDEYRSYSDEYRMSADMMKTIMAAFGPMAKKAAAMQEQFKQMKGFPLANTTTTRNAMGHQSVSKSEVTAIKLGPIPASTWEIPAGYTRVDNPMMTLLGRRGKS